MVCYNYQITLPSFADLSMDFWHDKTTTTKFSRQYCTAVDISIIPHLFYSGLTTVVLEFYINTAAGWVLKGYFTQLEFEINFVILVWTQIFVK